MKKKIMVMLLVSFLVGLIPNQAMAVGSIEPWAVVNRINGASGSMSFDLDGDYGLLFNLKHIINQALWTEYASESLTSSTNSDDKLSSAEVQVLADRLKQNVNSFNEAYNNIDSTYIRAGVDMLPENPGSYGTLAHHVLYDGVPLIIETYLGNMSAEYLNSGLSPEEQDKWMKSRKSLLKEIITCLDSGVDAGNILTGTVHRRYEGILTNPNYMELITEARSVSMNELGDYTNIESKDANTFIEQYADVMVTEKGIQAGASGEYSLEAQYLAILAASSVYIPFKSNTGDTDFQNALKAIINNDTEYEEIIASYMMLKNTKKPLYYVEHGYLGTKKEATRVTLEKFIELCEGEGAKNNGEFVMERGILNKVDDNTNSWAYFKPDYSSVIAPDGNQSLESNSQVRPTNENTVNDDINDASTLAGGTNSTTTTVSATTQSSSSTATIPFNGKIEKLESSYVMDMEKISITSETTEPVFGIGICNSKSYLGKGIMSNIILSSKVIEKIPNKNMRLIYMNAFGDIVLDDNTVVLPGSANPYFINEEFGFSPYSAAVMNYLPDIVDSSERVKTTSKDDKNKFIFAVKGNILEKESRDELPSLKYKLMRIDAGWIDRNIFLQDDITNGTRENDIIPLYVHSMPVEVDGETAIIDQLKTKEHTDSITGSISNQLMDFGYYPVIKIAYSLNGSPIFPYTQDSSAANWFIANNMYWTYTTSTGVQSEGENGRIDAEYMIKNVLLEGLFGVDYNTYAKDMENTYDWYSNTLYGRFSKLVLDILRPIVNSTGSVDGVLGVKNSYEDGILSRVLSVFENYMWLILFSFAIFLVLVFMRQRISLIHTIVLGSFIMLVLVAMVRVIPVYIPVVFNGMTQNIINELNYSILTSKMEVLFDSGSTRLRVDDKGDVISDTGNATLYKMNSKQMTEFCNMQSIERYQLLEGTPYVMNEDNGLYVEGDSIKISLDSLFGNPIGGSYQGPDAGRYFEFEYRKLSSSPVDYYMPYNLIVDNFLTRLNSFVRICNVPRRVADYGNGYYKESFAVYSYCNSALFLTPGDYDYLMQTCNTEVVAELMATFDKNKDWLGLSDLIRQEDSVYRETLWWHTMEQNGYISYVPGTMELDEKSIQKLNDLIEYVNYQTKLFIINDLNTHLGSMSDENMIKVICFYATCMFNNKVSDLGNWLYPNNVNFPDLTLNDVMLGAFTDEYDKFVAMNYDILDYMYAKYDLLHTLVFILDMVAGFVVANALKFLVPVMYILFSALLIYNFVVDNNNKDLIKGYFKILIRCIIIIVAFCLSFTLATYFNKSAISLWVLLLCNGLIIWFVIDSIQRVLRSPTTLGGGNVVTQGNIFNQFNRKNKFNDFRTNNLVYNRRNQMNHIEQNDYVDDRFVRYKMRGNPNRVYEGKNSSRSSDTMLDDFADRQYNRLYRD